MEQVGESEDNQIHLVEEQIHPTHLTISDYEDAFIVHQVFEDVHDSFAQGRTHQIYQIEMQKKYDGFLCNCIVPVAIQAKNSKDAMTNREKQHSAK